MALLAVSKKNKVGVDIEWMGRRVKDLDIARHFFSNRELKELEHLPYAQKIKMVSGKHTHIKRPSCMFLP